MKVFDRYEGVEVELPALVEPGRYRLLRSAVLNGRVEIAKGESLWSDGSTRCVLSARDLAVQPLRGFKTPPLARDLDPSDDVVECALRELALQMDATDRDVLPSPVMPAQLDEMAELHPLERLLRETLDEGHLEHIARHPRMDMRYDAEVLPVSRAKRLASDVLTHLASHSEDWHRRGVTGVVPSRLKAEISEDELAIYENVVFVRLLERLRDWLVPRVKNLRTLSAKHESAEALQEAERLDYRLRNALCALWGRSLEDEQSAGRSVRQALSELQALLGMVKQLLQSGLANAVPPTQRIPSVLRDTNILRHDTHYRHLRPLWLPAHAEGAVGRASPEERFERERSRGRLQRRYVELLLRHALKAIILLAPDKDGHWHLGPWRLSLEPVDDEWVLRLNEGSETEPAALCFVPAARGHLAWSAQRSDRLVIFCLHERARELGDECGGDSVLSPLEFYGVERLRAAVESWLLSRVVQRWPFKAEPIPPAAVRALTEAGQGALASSARGVNARAPTTPSITSSLNAIATKISPDVGSAVARALELAELLGTCRLCGTKVVGRDFDVSPQGFKASCQCGHEWALSRRDSARNEARYGIGGSLKSFEEFGSLCLVVKT